MKRTLKSNRKILVVGSAVVDVVIQIDALPKTGEDVMGTHKQTIVGGCAYNVQQVIGHFGLTNTLFTPIGKGTYAEIIRDEFLKKEIPVLLEDLSQDNGWNISFVECSGERTFLTIAGIETHWKDEWFDHLNLSEFDFIYVSGYELEGPSGNVLVEQLVKKKAPYTKLVFDPGPRTDFISDSVMNAILTAGTIVHCNDSELLTLIPNETIENAAAKLHALTNEAVVVTLGKYGSYYLDKDKSGHLSTEKVKVVDTIGAGDSHTGAFISGLASGLTIGEACLLGNEVSTKVVQQSGGTFVGL